MAIKVRVSSCSTIFFFRALPKRLYDFKTLWLVYWLVGALWRDTKTVIGLTIVQDAVLVHFVLEQRTQQRTYTYQHNVSLSTRSISTLGSVPWHLVKTEGFLSFFQQSMEITLNGQIGPSAADHVAAASKRGNVNASTPVPATTAEIVKRLGRQSRKFIVIHSPVQVS